MYCLEVLAGAEGVPVENKENRRKCVEKALLKLYGYEIDPKLALVAAINLGLKCLMILSEAGYRVSVEDFDSFAPEVYFPVNDTVAGALDVLKTQQMLEKAGTGKKFASGEVFANIDTVITNPPFQTVKGMPEDLKEYLKKEYPDSKCDMCNAFIGFSYALLMNHGVAGLVTQNSWMYLDSFIDFRQKVLSSCTIYRMWELGSDAFYDLSGEKSNVALFLYRKEVPKTSSCVQLTSLKSKKLSEKEAVLLSYKEIDRYTSTVNQRDIYENDGSRFDMISSAHLRETLTACSKYESYAIPMQGTSTGDAKKLIDFYWNHIGDTDWIPVSKGGGYSRWCGLNHYCVKWGMDGEYIRRTKGSAIRNANYFNQTSMVFSDTGTSGLNVRELIPKQIFVASGPGIRIKQGKTYAHLAVLNSRYASYYIRLLSPKLTIAGGYIAKLPISLNLLESTQLEKYGRQCVQLKRHRLSKRPFNMEFQTVCCQSGYTHEEVAHRWFMEDIEDEWKQLQIESRIDEIIFKEMNLSEEDRRVIDDSIGVKRVWSLDDDENIDIYLLENSIKKNLDSNCNISRTKVGKSSLGCDGLLEFLSQKNEISCECIYNYISGQRYYPECLKKKYEGLYLHAVTLSILGFPDKPESLDLEEIMLKMTTQDEDDSLKVKNWLRMDFDRIHREAFMKSPIFEYDSEKDMVMYRGKQL